LLSRARLLSVATRRCGLQLCTMDIYGRVRPRNGPISTHA
jgi:hypothetical protein